MTKNRSGLALFNGMAVLGIAAILSKLIGTMQKIPLQNIGGDEVYGLYHAVFPFYTFILVLATAGFPIAVSKFVSERLEKGDEAGANQVLAASLWVLIAAGMLCFALLYVGAPVIADWIGNQHTVLPIRTMSFALLVVPVMAAFRGFFQGRQNMVPTSVSQVVEQTIRVTVMVLLLIVLTNQGASAASVAAGATFGGVAGALAGLIVMLGYWLLHRRKQALSKPPDASSFTYVIPLILYAMPVAMGALAVPILNLVDTFTVPRFLQAQGMSESEAMAAFGIYNRGLPLVQLASMIFTSMSVAFVPAFTEARLKGDMAGIRHQALTGIRLAWLMGAAASIGLAVVAEPVNRMLFMNDNGSFAMSILAFTALFSILHIVSASMLQGLGRIVLPAVFLIFGAILKTVLNVAWVPRWGIEGAAAAAVAAFALSAVLCLIVLFAVVRPRMGWWEDGVKPLLALSGMIMGLYIWLQGFERMSAVYGWIGRGWDTFLALSAVCIGAIIYLSLLYGLKHPLLRSKSLSLWRK